MDKVSSRYAEALLDIALSTHQVMPFKAQAKAIGKALKDNPDFVALFNKTQLSSDEKKALITSVFKGKADPMILNLFYLMVDKHRMGLAVAVLEDFVHMANKKLAIEEGIVYSIRPLSKEDLEALEKQLSHKHNVTVELTNKLDPELISGLKIKFKESVIDASLSAKLEALRETLREGRS